MKKIALSSLLAVFAVTGAYAATDVSNPMYRPDAGHFYSVTTLNTDTSFDRTALTEEFGYGITDKLSIKLGTALSYEDDSAREFGWDYLNLGLNYRYVDNGAWKADVYGEVEQQYTTGENFDTLRTDWYNWKVGTKVGYVTGDWTLAGLVDVNYRKDDQSGFDSDSWFMKVGVEGQYVLCPNWNVVAGLNYNFDIASDDFYGDDERLNLKLGANYNIDATKFVGVYVEKEVTSDFDENPMEFGVKFGVDF